MQENEVIVVDGIPPADYDALILDCVKYAIISMPFTVDRMSIPNEIQRALNIAKGKVAERLFEYFCIQNGIPANFVPCATPFWTVDNRDFILNGSEWDIKNNFYYCAGNLITNNKYSDFPALVPNRSATDQWGKRNVQLLQQSTQTEFLFTFLKNADLINGNRGIEFLEIILSQGQIQLLKKLYAKYNGQPQTAEPYTEVAFWQAMQKQGTQQLFKLNFRPILIITGFANQSHWGLFKDTGPYDRNNNYQTYLNPRWYTKSMKGSCNFMNGTLWTTITNATCPLSLLPSFLSLFPQLQQNIKCGRILP